MIEKYKCEVDENDYFLIISYDTEGDFYFLPSTYIRNKNKTVNYFKSLHEIEDEFGVRLRIVDIL